MGWWGSWYGDAGTGGGGGGPIIITNNTTTAEAIRDRIISLIRALTPNQLTANKFDLFTDEREADIRAWAASVGQGSFRTFQVRETGQDNPPDISNMDVESRLVTFEITVCYPQTSRAGKNAARDRDDLITDDQHLIEHNVGMCGYANFTGASAPNAAWYSGETRRDREDGIDYLVITQTMRFYRRMVP